MHDALPISQHAGQAAPVILLMGANGQLGRELRRSLQGLGRIVAVDHPDVDFADFDRVREVVRELRPAVIVNAAAHTAVDRAEDESALVQRINAQAPGVLAEEAKRLGAALIHYSTDYVFDGALARPYVETDAPHPLNVYGLSKLNGEAAIAQVSGRYLILRTSWVYGLRGSNFLLTMLRLAQDRDEIRVVSDQHGAPTWTRTIAAATAQILAQRPREPQELDAWWARHAGLYHLTAAGSTSWHGFASAIFSYLPEAMRPTVVPVGTADYPTPASRPKNSCLSTEKVQHAFGFVAPDWEDALNCVMDEYIEYARRFRA